MADAIRAQSFFYSAQEAREDEKYGLLTLRMPPIPDPAAVSLQPAKTALIISDMTGKILKDHPARGTEIIRPVQRLLASARTASTIIVYSARLENASDWLREVKPVAGDLFVAAHGQDRFFNSDLDKTLQDHGIEIVILSGWKMSGSLLYTAIGATLRGYTVVVPVDASSAPVDFELFIGMYQMLNQFHPNVRNEPLKERAVTLSRTDLITFRS